MRFELNIYIVLIFLVPGMICFSSIFFFANPDQIEIAFQYIVDKKLDSILLVLIVLFVLGAIIDTLRTILIDKLLDWLIKVFYPDLKLPNYVSAIDENNLAIFEMLNQKTHSYYRLNANMFLSFLILWCAVICCANNCLFFIIVLTITILVLWAAYSAKLDVIYTMQEFYNSHKKQI